MLLGLLAVGLNGASARAEITSSGDLLAQCNAIQREDFSQVPDALIQIMEVKSVAASGAAASYCQVTGYVAPSIGFALRLPISHWNGKLIELGCGGKCGSLDHVSGCESLLRRGYACIVSDGGHKSSVNDAKWAYNNFQAQMDYLVQASHVTALAGKAIVERYYAEVPQKSYFLGCSAGGTQAMQEAQKFPWDFDGIVAGAPVLSWTTRHVNMLWDNRAFTDKSGKPLLQRSDLDTLHAAVVRQCDLNDGVVDGMIGDPRLCDFHPDELLCTANKKTGCLTAKQIDAVKSLYSGPISPKGERIASPDALPGSERTWLDFFSGTSSDTRATYNLVAESFRYQDFQPNPGPAWRPEDFDIERDYKRLGISASLEPVNPDLRKFKAAGGKLLVYAGWADVAAGALPTVDYYEAAERVVGSRAATQVFFRLFVVPGMYHCFGGEGAFAIDYLTYLEAWVERDQAPEKLIGFHVKPEDLGRLDFPPDPTLVEFTRPIFPYPSNTHYLGHGDPKDAANFGPIDP
jgi:feruloyl esterase